MEAVTSELKESLSRSTGIDAVIVTQTSGEVAADQGAQFRVRFSLRGGLVDTFNRATWQQAYDVHDTSLRLLYWITMKKKGAFRSSAIGEPSKFLKKATLYWTRNPDLTDNVTNRIWAMVVSEEKVPHIFDSERELRDYLFTFDRRILVPAAAISRVSGPLVAEVRLKWGRHSFIEKGHVVATSDPFELKR